MRGKKPKERQRYVLRVNETLVEVTRDVYLAWYQSRRKERYQLEKMQKNGAKPLSDLTNGVHLHQICCESEDILHRIQAALEQRGILYHSKV